MGALRIAIVGCGRMGALRAAACARLGARVVQLIDADRASAERLAATLPSATVAERPDWPNLDAVFVCTPPAARGPVELEAIAHGVPFFVEKPVGLDVARMLPVARALAERPLVTGVGYMNRHRAGVNRLRRRLEQSRPVAFSAFWLNGIYAVPWWREPGLSGGPLNEQATHFLDLARYLLGEVDEVAAAAEPHPDHPTIVGSAAIRLRLASGVLGAFAYSCRAAYKSMAFRIFTEGEELALDGWDVLATLPEEIREPAPDDRYAIFDQETADFLNALEDGNAAPLCPFADALRTQAVADAVARSVASGAAERVEPVRL